MSSALFQHSRNHGLKYIKQALHVNIQHFVPVVNIALVNRTQAISITCVVYQDINVCKCLWKAVDCFKYSFSFAHVEAQGMHFHLCGELSLHPAKPFLPTPAKN